MSNTTIGSASMQADDNGLVALQCDRCKAMFKISFDYLNNELRGDLCCPVCGISAELNTFFPEYVVEAAKEIALAHAEELIVDMFKGLNSKNIKVTTKPIGKVDTHRVFKDRDIDMVVVHADCCGKDLGLKSLDAGAGYYCPYCGRIAK